MIAFISKEIKRSAVDFEPPDGFKSRQVSPFLIPNSSFALLIPSVLNVSIIRRGTVVPRVSSNLSLLRSLNFDRSFEISFFCSNSIFLRRPISSSLSCISLSFFSSALSSDRSDLILSCKSSIIASSSSILEA